MSRFTSPDANGAPGPMGPTGPAGADANTGDIDFIESTMTAHADMTIGVDVVPGTINISAYSGVNIQTNESAGLYVNGIDPNNKVVTFADITNISDTSLPIGGTGGQILAKIDDTDYNAEWIDNWATYSGYTNVVKHEVKAGDALTKGQAVYVSSADGTNMIVSKASNSGENTSSKTMGLVESSVSLNGKVNVITEGLLAGLNTNGATAGDPVWLGTNGDLIYGLANKPVAPAHLVFIGIVTRANANNGEIFIRPQNGFEVNELHDVLIGSGYSSTPTDNDILAYDSASGLWKNQTAAQAGLATVSAGSVLKDTMLSNSQLNVVSTTIAQTTSNVNFVTYNYTPVSSSSYLMIDFHLSKYIVPGSMDDSYYSILLVDGNEISYGYQAFNDDGPGTNNRTGVLFPLMGRYTNSSTSAKQIQIAARRGSADDSITIDSGTESTMWLRITEVAR